MRIGSPLSNFSFQLDLVAEITLNVSVNSKPDHPPGIRTFSLLGRLGFCPTSFARGGRYFELEKFSTGLKEKCKNFSICLKETACVPVQFHVNFCIFNNIDDFPPFRSFDNRGEKPAIGQFCVEASHD